MENSTEVKFNSIFLDGERIFDVTATIYKAKPMQNIPESYKHVGSGVCVTLKSSYQSGFMEFYRTKNRTLIFSMYVDGCFHAQYGRIIITSYKDK